MPGAFGVRCRSDPLFGLSKEPAEGNIIRRAPRANIDGGANPIELAGPGQGGVVRVIAGLRMERVKL